jgi:ABC-type branched-subunit amino acid transport system ATPase component
MFGTSLGGIAEPLPKLSWIDLQSGPGFYRLVLVITTCVAVVVVLIGHGRLGRLLQGLADSDVALMISGTSTVVVRITAFCISAYIAGISGALTGATLGFVGGANFDPFQSLSAFILLMICVGGAPWYAIIAGISFTVIPGYIQSPTAPYYLDAIFGIFAILVAVSPRPEVAGSVRVFLSRLAWRPTRLRAVPPGPVVHLEGRSRGKERCGLKVQDLSVSFGRLRAVNGVSFQAPPAQITGLIGPNGAGKTTAFNAISGLVRGQPGKVWFGGLDISGRSPSARARLGLGRTFQQPELYESMSVIDNVALGLEASLAGANPMTQLFATPRQRQIVRAAAAAALEFCGLADTAHQNAGSLTTGQRRLVEFARCLAGSHKVLLLDEPSAGLDQDESRQLGSVLRRAVDSQEVAILLIEHDVELVMDICTQIFVMDFGEIIFQGSPSEVRASDVVRKAYLGTAGSAV